MSNKWTSQKLPHEHISTYLLSHTKNETLIILTHGLGATKEDAGVHNLATYLHCEGYSVLTYDLLGHGQRVGNPFDIPAHVADLLTLVKRYRLYRRIVLIGGSMGALIATIASMQSVNIAGLASVNGFFTIGYPQQGYRKIYLQFRVSAIVNRTIRRYWNYVKRWLRAESVSLPTLVLASSDDADINPIESMRWYKKLTCKKTFALIPYGDHKLTEKHMIEFAGTQISRWIKKLD